MSWVCVTLKNWIILSHRNICFKFLVIILFCVFSLQCWDSCLILLSQWIKARGKKQDTKYGKYVIYNGGFCSGFGFGFGFWLGSGFGWNETVSQTLGCDGNLSSYEHILISFYFLLWLSFPFRPWNHFLPWF